jgi:hypothetical protein
MIVNPYALRQLHACPTMHAYVTTCQPICTQTTSCMPHGACIRNNYPPSKVMSPSPTLLNDTSLVGRLSDDVANPRQNVSRPLHGKVAHPSRGRE